MCFDRLTDDDTAETSGAALLASESFYTSPCSSPGGPSCGPGYAGSAAETVSQYEFV
jgi:hypothetical protein